MESTLKRAEGNSRLPDSEEEPEHIDILELYESIQVLVGHLKTSVEKGEGGADTSERLKREDCSVKLRSILGVMVRRLNRAPEG